MIIYVIGHQEFTTKSSGFTFKMQWVIHPKILIKTSKKIYWKYMVLFDYEQYENHQTDWCLDQVFEF